VLQGRPRLTATFKELLFQKMKVAPNSHANESVLHALNETESIALEDFRQNINKFVRGAGEEYSGSPLSDLAKVRLNLMIELVLRGSIDIDNVYEYDLVSKGIIYLEALSDKATYKPVEPLMLRALYRYLEKEGYDYAKLIAMWMRQTLKQGQEQKGYTAEVLLAHLLVMLNKELQGKSLTSNELFVEYKGTFLDDYTLSFSRFQHDEKDLWKDVLRNQRTDVLVLSRTEMGPDLFDQERIWAKSIAPIMQSLILGHYSRETPRLCKIWRPKDEKLRLYSSKLSRTENELFALLSPTNRSR